MRRARDVRGDIDPGYSLVELLVVVAIVLISVAVGVMSLSSPLESAHVNTAVQLTLGELRKARQIAMDTRTEVEVTFNPPGSPPVNILVQTVVAGATTTVGTANLPSDIQFVAVNGIPTDATKTPNQFGAGVKEIDFDQGVASPQRNTVFFFPDGTARDAAGNTNNGVIYIAKPGSLYSSRAVTLRGATGQLKVWYLTKIGVTPTWQ